MLVDVGASENEGNYCKPDMIYSIPTRILTGSLDTVLASLAATY